MSRLQVHALNARLDGQPFLRDISLDLPSGALHVILGPSGCGKTTLLRTLSGLHPHTDGRIVLGDLDVGGEPPERRGLVLLQQEPNLFPHLSVHENVAFGLRLRGLALAEVESRVRQLLDLVNLPRFGPRRPHTLSGGEKQRVALARALAVRPEALLLDEPLSALDRALRQTLRDDLRHILRAEGTTALYVTHDQDEALALADQLHVMLDGRLIDTGEPARVHHDPGNAATARVLGRRNLWPGRTDPNGHLWVADADLGPRPDAPSTPQEILVREEDVTWVEDPEGPETIEASQFLGTRTAYRIQRGPLRVHAERPGPPTTPTGTRVRIPWTRIPVRIYPNRGVKTPNP